MATWGADAQLTRVLEQHGTSLLRLAVLITGSRFDGEDAFQNALVAVAESWQRTRPRVAHAYLRRVVATECFRLMRARRDVLTDAVPERGVDEPRFLRLEEDQRFFSLLAGLPEKQRATLVLRYFADLDDRAIGELLDCTVETVRSQASRALAKLRDSDAVNGRA